MSSCVVVLITNFAEVVPRIIFFIKKVNCECVIGLNFHILKIWVPTVDLKLGIVDGWKYLNWVVIRIMSVVVPFYFGRCFFWKPLRNITSHFNTFVDHSRRTSDFFFCMFPCNRINIDSEIAEDFVSNFSKIFKINWFIITIKMISWDLLNVTWKRENEDEQQDHVRLTR